MRSGSVQIQAVNASLILRQLLLGGLGRLDVEDALLTAPSSMTCRRSAASALLSASCSSSPAWRRDVPHSEVPAAVPCERRASRRSRTRSRRLWWMRDVGIHRLRDEGVDVGGGYPRRAETRGDVGGPQVLRLHAPQRRDIARIVPDRAPRRLRRSPAWCGPDRTDRRRPSPSAPVAGIAEHGVAEFGERVVGIAVAAVRRGGRDRRGRVSFSVTASASAAVAMTGAGGRRDHALA